MKYMYNIYKTPRIHIKSVITGAIAECFRLSEGGWKQF